MNDTPKDFTHKIAEHEATKGAERVAYEDLSPGHPAYLAVRIAAESVDMDLDLLTTRVERIVGEVRDLATEAIRVRDQHEVQIDALKAAVPVTTITTSPFVPPTLVHWIRRQIALHPLGSDGHPILTEPAVTLGELRAFLAEYDRGVKP